MARRKCVTVLPEGDADIHIGQRCDDLFELTIEPAMEKLGFDVIRSDRNTPLSALTPEMVEMIQTSDLCIFDLTGSDPNVLYLCGRRHETARPAIHLLQSGAGNPLVLTGISVVPYDVSTARGVQTLSMVLMDSTQQFDDREYAATSSGATLATLAQSIDRIERKLEKLDVSHVNVPDVADSEDWDALELQLMGPEAVHNMIAAGQLDAAVVFIRKSRDRFGMDSFLALAVLPVMAGSFSGFNYLKSITREIIFDPQEVEDDHVMLIIGALVQYFSVREQDTGGLQELGHIFTIAKDKFKDNNRLMAFLHIQLSKLQINSGYVEDAVKNLEMASTQYGDSDAARHLAQVKKEMERQN